MKTTTLALALLFAGACAATDGNFAGGTTANNAVKGSTKTEQKYEAMNSLPPEAPKESIPELRAGEAWVPGYYQPVAGTWLWHQGQIRQTKDGYTLVPASYREESGKIYFTPPRYVRNDLLAKHE
jgi:hypothetical protein